MIIKPQNNSLHERDVRYKEIAEKLRKEKENNKDFKVLNVGGTLDRIGLPVDAIFDIRGADNENSDQNLRVYPYDICKKDSWNEIADHEYDFVVCTHTLEDVRDPFFVIEQLQRVAKAGYIAVPSKTRELQFCRSFFHLGYAHHRWIFTIEGGKLLMMPKFSFVEHLVKSNKIPWVTKPAEPIFINIIRLIRYKVLSLFNKPKEIFQLWIKVDKLADYEISFEWKDNFEFNMIGDDLFLPPYQDAIVDEYIKFGKGL